MMKRFFSVYLLLVCVFMPRAPGTETESASAEAVAPFLEFLRPEFERFALKNTSEAIRLKLIPFGGKPAPDAHFLIVPAESVKYGKSEPFAFKGKVIAVSEENPFRNLSREDAGKLLNFKLEFWPASRKKIRSVRTFEKHTPEKGKSVFSVPDTEILMETLRKSPLSAGILPLAVLTEEHRGIRFLSVDGIAPSRENVLNGKYPLAIRCDLVVLRKGLFEPLLRKITTESARRKILESGAIPFIPEGFVKK